VREAATICPAPCKLTFDLLTLKEVPELRVTWATSVPILVFLGLSHLRNDLYCVEWDVKLYYTIPVLDLGPMYTRQTDRRQMRIVA